MMMIWYDSNVQYNLQNKHETFQTLTGRRHCNAIRRKTVRNEKNLPTVKWNFFFYIPPFQY